MTISSFDAYVDIIIIIIIIQHERKARQPTCLRIFLLSKRTLKSDNQHNIIFRLGEISTTVRNACFQFFFIFHAIRWRVSSVMREIHSWIFCFSSSTTINVQWQKSSGVRSGDRWSHELRDVMQWPKNSRVFSTGDFVGCATSYCNQ